MTGKSPHTTLSLFGVIPAKLWHITIIIAIYEMLLSRGSVYRTTTAAHQGHLAGIAVGLGAFFGRRFGLRL